MAEEHRQGHAGRFLLLGKVRRRRSVRAKRGPVNRGPELLVKEDGGG